MLEIREAHSRKNIGKEPAIKHPCRRERNFSIQICSRAGGNATFQFRCAPVQARTQLFGTDVLPCRRERNFSIHMCRAGENTTFQCRCALAQARTQLVNTGVLPCRRERKFWSFCSEGSLEGRDSNLGTNPAIKTRRKKKVFRN